MNTRFHNTYYALRHGESVSNRAGLIQSDLEQGQHESLGLTPLGKEQVLASIVEAQIANLLDRSTLILSSPYTRCLETAQIVKEQIKAINPIQFDDRLRERDFGELNDQPIQSYQEVWDADKAGSAHPDHGIESATMVLHRVMSLIHELEKRYQGRTFILVSHGDPLHILQAGILQKPAHLHQELPPLTNGELRKL